MAKHSADDIRLKYLLDSYLANSCSHEEMEELLRHLSEDADSAVLFSTFEAVWAEGREEEVLENRRRLRSRRMSRFRAASFAILLGLVIGSGLLLRHYSRMRVPVKSVVLAPRRYKNDVKPGGNKAVLVLSNGQTIVLDSAGLGTLAVQAGMKVIKLSNGRLLYQPAVDIGDSVPVYNTISTPRGGQYELVLQDGTRVWLNSESSLRYPTVFTGKERSVELSGEAYFEVAPRAVSPFKIYMLDQSSDGRNRKEIDVLGTNFNVMAYQEEKVVRTTLVEGALSIGDKLNKRLLRPGQQAEWLSGPETQVKITDDVDVDAAIAWKNGFFSFDRCDIHRIMRQLSRWYDLKVIYNGRGVAKSKVFWGGIQKNLPLSDVLRILEKGGVEFSIDGNNVTVNM